MQRVAMYVDGLNLYNGLRDGGLQRYYWLDMRRLAENLLRPGQKLVAVRYFTARIAPDTGRQGGSIRQNTYLEALSTLPDVHVHLGVHIPKTRRCRKCRATWKYYEEKMTDVNIAVELLGDAQDDTFDTAIIVSGDGDLTGPTSAVRQRHPDKRVVVAFPPNRRSFELRNAATAHFPIGRRRLSESQLPDRITKPDGYVLTRPPSWR